MALLLSFIAGGWGLPTRPAAWAADSTQDGDASTSAPVTVSMAATVRGRLTVSLTCQHATAGSGPDSINLDYGGINAFPASGFSPFADTARPSIRDETNTLALHIEACTLTTKVSAFGATARLKAAKSAGSTLSIGLAADGDVIGGSGDFSDVQELTTTLTLVSDHFGGSPGAGTKTSSTDLIAIIRDTDSLGAKAATVTFELSAGP